MGAMKQPLQRWQPPTAREANALDAVVRQSQRQRHGAPALREAPPQRSVVLARNDSEVAFERCAVVGLAGVAITPDDNEGEFITRPLMSAVEPTALHRSNFAVTLEPIEPGGIGRVVVSGLAVVQVSEDDQAPDADLDDHAAGSVTRLLAGYQTQHPISLSAVPGESYLIPATRGSGGAKLLWWHGTDTFWATVLLGPCAPQPVTFLSYQAGEPGTLRLHGAYLYAGPGDVAGARKPSQLLKSIPVSTDARIYLAQEQSLSYMPGYQLLLADASTLNAEPYLPIGKIVTGGDGELLELVDYSNQQVFDLRGLTEEFSVRAADSGTGSPGKRFMKFIAGRLVYTEYTAD